MDALMIVLRLIHIGFGIFWVGTSLFLVFFLTPAMKRSGPAGGLVMGKLATGKFASWIAAAALLVVVAGLVMYTLDSHGFQSSWILSPGPLTLTFGAFFGLLAAGVGFFVQRPILLRLAAIQKEIAQSGGQPNEQQTAEILRLQVRLDKASRLAVIFMVLAVIGMESAREVGSIE